MAGTDGDPFDWDVDKVVHELCAVDSRPWLPRLATKRPDPAALSTALIENDIDGETLLTYEDVMPSIKDLLETLGLSKPAHQMTLVKAIKYLKSKSPDYQQYKVDSAKHDLDMQGSSQEDRIDSTGEATPPTTDHPAESTRPRDVPMPDTPQQSHSLTSEPHTFNSVVSGSSNLTASSKPDEAPDGPLQKKRKIAPVLISTDVTGAGISSLPNAASGVTLHFPRRIHTEPVDRPASNHAATPGPTTKSKADTPAWLDSSPGAYFGRNSLITADWVPKSSVFFHENEVLEENQPVELAYQAMVPAGKRVLDLYTHSLIPPGNRRQIGRAIRRLHLRNNKSYNLLRNGIHPQIEPEDDDDEILPAFGDSDIDEEYDSDTLREMEDEEEQVRLEKERKSHNLTREEVNRVIEEEILHMEAAWEERKLPGKQRRAKAIWNQARRRGRHHLIAQASSRVDNFNGRIERLCNEMRRDEWQNEAQLRRQVCCLEATVHDRKADRWLLNILRGPEPPGPETMPRLLPPPPRHELLSDEDGEIISSDEDDGFIIDDMKGVTFSPEPEGIRQSTPMDLDDPGESAQLERPGPSAPANGLITKTPVAAPNSDVIDLTGFDSEPVSEKRRININLITPTKSKALRPSTEVDDDDPEHVPEEEDYNFPFDQQAAIAAVPPVIWKDRKDRERLLICILWNLKKKDRKAVFFKFIRTLSSDQIWEEVMIPALSHGDAEETEPTQKNWAEAGNMMARLFRVYEFCKVERLGASMFKKLPAGRAKKLSSQSANFESFCDFVREHIAPYFVEQHDPSPENSDQFTDGDIEDSPSQTRKKLVLDQAAKDLRENDMQRLQEQEKRRIELRKKLAASDLISSDKSRLIINESKQDDQGLIYVNEDIGKRIKDHQIQGVRFMWNQIICDPKARQGCLLAHTMGLGKTMQVITLLVAIAEAVKSDDDSIRSQIPKDLRQSKTLVLCPSLLVDNWMDELLMWAPSGLLGHYFKLEAVTSKGDRLPMIRRWDHDGGVMVIGYDLFKRLIEHPDEDQPQNDTGKNAWEILTQSPNIVVADEAHKMKNAESKLASAASHFRTHSRIALTGSPLANSVEEFYSMIDWVAPRYLGPLAEFKTLYSIPIQSGLYEDSTYSQFRAAKRQLSVLEKTVAPKAHRATVKSLMKNDLPQKTEFILTVPLEALQAQLYDDYIGSMKVELAGQGTKVLSSNHHLALIVNHPRCWYNKLTEERNIMNGKGSIRSASNITLSHKMISTGLKMMSRPKTDISSHMLSWKTRLLVAILDESEKVGDKVLIFTHSIPALDLLDSLFRQQRRKIARLDGSTPINQRQQHIKNFNTGDTQIYLISTTAGGVGLNIFGANRVVLFDFKYNPVHEQQAVGRAYRIGQLKPVYVYKFLSGGTFEAAMHNRAVFKTQLASRVVDKENPKRWSKKDNEYLKDREEPAQQDLSPQLGKDVVLDHLLLDPELVQGIRSIETTDTFEEQDPDDVLTPEDKKDVENQVRMNSLRITNPAEYERLEQERLRRVMSYTTAGVPNQTAGPAHATETAVPLPQVPTAQLPQLNPGLRQRPVGVPPHTVTPSGQPVQAHLGRDTSQSVADQELRPDRQGAQSLSATNNESVEATSNPETHHSPEVPVEHRGVPPMPMAGANTHFRTAEVPPPIALQGSTAAAQNGPKSTRKTPKRPSSEIDWALQFEEKIFEALQKVTDPEVLKKFTGDHHEFAKRIAQSTWQVRLEKNDGPLPDASHMKTLCGMMASHRFALAVLTGFLAPAQLALAPTFSALEGMEQELALFTEEEFRETLGLGSHSPEDHNV
ncbi:snf2 family helicase [Colletotrichum karsti]|uniref:Snf2 family helicase n=1 Tax=Colletotrichum karsti TaxID=1095194 RepID=A0A9P6LGP2_9PEZI|nr:snf2 family helicase [Colletotrichum karsti]KAF9871637.1 snf2 family helicase [Colletotrichum karsti]